MPARRSALGLALRHHGSAASAGTTKMLKRTLIGLVLMLSAAPLRAQTDLLPTLERIRDEYPTPMSHPQLAEYLNRVAWEHRGEGWGLLLKPGGNRCPAPQGVDVACDILVHAPTAQIGRAHV